MCARLAIEFRQEFKKRCRHRHVCYRRFGHNEGDEPAFTQPLMYKKIATQETTRSIYARKSWLRRKFSRRMKPRRSPTNFIRAS
jgi:2-oxoglutarate dehydrogenase complex dehydrogenase (E1) component-like enzyme